MQIVAQNDEKQFGTGPNGMTVTARRNLHVHLTTFMGSINSQNPRYDVVPR